MAESGKISSLGRILLYFFFFLCGLNLWAEYQVYQQLVYLTKPLLVSMLALFFYMESKSHPGRFRNFILGGLVFSVFGDTFLMFVEQGSGSAQFFLLGLGSFLIAHLFYLSAFLSYPGRKKGYCSRRPQVFLPFVLFLLSYNLYLWPVIPENLRIPVVLYSLAIVSMCMSCVNLYGKLKNDIFIGLFFGVLFFLFSDTIIGLNKFRPGSVSLVNPRVLIMSTYLLAQFLISYFALKAIKLV